MFVVVRRLHRARRGRFDVVRRVRVEYGERVHDGLQRKAQRLFVGPTGRCLTGPVGRWFKCVRGGNRDKNVEDAGTQSV